MKRRKSKIRTIKNCPRRRFTEKELELLEKLHYLHHKGMYLDPEKNESSLFITLFEKACKIIY